jgi:hypothetical protein
MPPSPCLLALSTYAHAHAQSLMKLLQLSDRHEAVGRGSEFHDMVRFGSKLGRKLDVRAEPASPTITDIVD